jgi:hypothetical protein
VDLDVSRVQPADAVPPAILPRPTVRPASRERAEAGGPVGVEVVGLTSMTHDDGPVGRKIDAEEVEDAAGGADRIRGQILVLDLERNDTLPGEPGLPSRLGLVDRVGQ